MSEVDDTFVQELRLQFAQDALDLAQEIEAALLALETNPTQEQLDALKRHLHCLKGNAKAVGFDGISRMAHETEARCEKKLEQDQIDHLLSWVDRFRESLQTFLASSDPAGLLRF